MKYRIRKHIISDYLDSSKTKPHAYYTIEKLCWKLWWMECWSQITNFKPLMKEHVFNSHDEAKDMMKRYDTYIKECESDGTIVETIELQSKHFS